MVTTGPPSNMPSHAAAKAEHHADDDVLPTAGQIRRSSPRRCASSIQVENAALFLGPDEGGAGQQRGEPVESQGHPGTRAGTRR